MAARLVVAIKNHEMRPTEIIRMTAGLVIARGPSNNSGW